MPEKWIRVIRTPEDRDRALRFMSQFGMARPLEITVRPYKPPHSDPQRRTFWMWAGEAAEQLREAGVPTSKDEIHDLILGDIYGWRKSALVPGKMDPAETISSPRKNKQQMTDILDHFQTWASEKGIELTIPEGDHA